MQITAGCKLAAKFVIHAVGPFYNERYAEKNHNQLRQLHTLALEAAVEHHCKSIAFPAISTGAYRFPIADAASTAIDSVCRFLNTTPGVELVRFVLYKQGQFDIFEATLEKWLP